MRNVVKLLSGFLGGFCLFVVLHFYALHSSENMILWSLISVWLSSLPMDNWEFPDCKHHWKSHCQRKEDLRIWGLHDASVLNWHINGLVLSLTSLNMMNSREFSKIDWEDSNKCVCGVFGFFLYVFFHCNMGRSLVEDDPSNRILLLKG